MRRITVVRALRTAIGLLASSALVTAIATLLDRGTFSVVRFFSYFTVDSNLLAGPGGLLARFGLRA
jgi:hypothetical protein